MLELCRVVPLAGHMDWIVVVENRELEALKIEGELTTPIEGTQSSYQQEDQDIPSRFIKRREQWGEQILRDGQEHMEAPSSTFRESIPLKIFSIYMGLMSSINESKPSTFEEE